MSKDFETIEQGYINGEPYYVARRVEDGWTRCFLGAKRKRRTMAWLKKQKKLELVYVEWRRWSEFRNEYVDLTDREAVTRRTLQGLTGNFRSDND
jgi:hypothetical protein